MTSEGARKVILPDIDPSLLIGVPVIDEEHYDLFARLAALDGNIEATPCSAAFSEILSRLGQQIGAHFDSEEKVFRSLDLPADDVLSHIQAHTAILDQYTQLNLDLMAGQALVRSEVLAMIRRWIVDHLMDHDIKIRNFLVPCRPTNA